MKTLIKNVSTLFLFITAGWQMEVNKNHGSQMPTLVRFMGLALAACPWFLHKTTTNRAPDQVGIYNISNAMKGVCPALPSAYIPKKP